MNCKRNDIEITATRFVEICDHFGKCIQPVLSKMSDENDTLFREITHGYFAHRVMWEQNCGDVNQCSQEFVTGFGAALQIAYFLGYQAGLPTFVVKEEK